MIELFVKFLPYFYTFLFFGVLAVGIRVQNKLIAGLPELLRKDGAGGRVALAENLHEPYVPAKLRCEYRAIMWFGLAIVVSAAFSASEDFSVDVVTLVCLGALLFMISRALRN